MLINERAREGSVEREKVVKHVCEQRLCIRHALSSLTGSTNCKKNSLVPVPISIPVQVPDPVLNSSSIVGALNWRRQVANAFDPLWLCISSCGSQVDFLKAISINPIEDVIACLTCPQPHSLSLFASLTLSTAHSPSLVIVFSLLLVFHFFGTSSRSRLVYKQKKKSLTKSFQLVYLETRRIEVQMRRNYKFTCGLQVFI